MPGQHKVLGLDDLLAQVSLWKDQGMSVVFTNGCFDVLHEGHVHVLEQAASKGDKLIVALNSDASVRNLKGTKRPIMSERARCKVLAALEVVSAVITFAEDTPGHLITAIKPDVLVKGGDYDLGNIVGAEYVNRMGGKVEVVPMLPGQSTSSIIDRILTLYK